MKTQREDPRTDRRHRNRSVNRYHGHQLTTKTLRTPLKPALHAVPRRQRGDHHEVDQRPPGQTDHRHPHHQPVQRTDRRIHHQLPARRTRAHDTRRARRHTRGRVPVFAARRAAVSVEKDRRVNGTGLALHDGDLRQLVQAPMQCQTANALLAFLGFNLPPYTTAHRSITLLLNQLMSCRKEQHM